MRFAARRSAWASIRSAAPASITGRAIAERYGLDLTVVNEAVDPTFRFMTVDWDGQIRMDPSSPYAMQRLIGLKDRFDIAFACDTDHDRHGIVTRSAGLLPPNHYLAVAIHYLFQHRPQWSKHAAVGKTVVSSADDRSRRARSSAGSSTKCRSASSGSSMACSTARSAFGGEESAGASFLRVDGARVDDGQGWHRPGAAVGGDHGAHGPRSRRRSTASSRASSASLVRPRRGAGDPGAEGECCAGLSPQQVPSTDLAGEKIQSILSQRTGQRRAHRRVEGDCRERMVRGASVRHRRYLQDLCGELSRGGSSAPHRDEAQTIVDTALVAGAPASDDWRKADEQRVAQPGA